MSESSTSANAVVRASLLKIDPDVVLASVDGLDLRAHAKVSAVIGVPLRQLQQRRDVTAFATSAPMAAVRGVLEVLAMAPLERVIELLGDHSESPTYGQLAEAIDEFLTSGGSVSDAVAVLAYAVGESFPAAPHCRRLLEERGEFALPELPEVVTPTILVAAREVSPEIREQRKARREEEKRRKKPSSPVRPARPSKSKGAGAARPASNAKPAVASTPPTGRRHLPLTPLESSIFSQEHPLSGVVLVLDVTFDASDPLQPEVSSKDRPVLVVAGADAELLVRPIYSNPAATRSLFQAWRRLGLDHASYVDDARVVVAYTSADLRSRLGQLTTSEWNALV